MSLEFFNGSMGWGWGVLLWVGMFFIERVYRKDLFFKFLSLRC